MAKVVPRRRRRPQRETNWLLIGSIVVVGVVGLFALLFVTLQGDGVPTPTPEPVALTAFCAANEENCVEKGNPDAPVTIVEVSDYGCGHCRNFNLEGTADALDEMYVDSGQVRWIVLPYALGDATAGAAEAALCAAEQDAFFEFHHEMFVIQTTDAALTGEGFVDAAEEVRMDADAFTACYESNRYRDAVQRNIAMATRAGVSATPTFFINGMKFEGNRPLANFQREIERAMES